MCECVEDYESCALVPFQLDQTARRRVLVWDGVTYLSRAWVLCWYLISCERLVWAMITRSYLLYIAVIFWVRLLSPRALNPSRTCASEYYRLLVYAMRTHQSGARTGERASNWADADKRTSERESNCAQVPCVARCAACADRLDFCCCYAYCCSSQQCWVSTSLLLDLSEQIYY